MLLRKLLICFYAFLISIPGFSQCPKPASCTPSGPTAPNADIFDMGIRNVTLGSINNSTGFINVPSDVSYKDYSCTDSTDITVGVSVPISITTNGSSGGLNNENVRVWIDLNNDGAFDPIGELVFESLDARVHTGTINLPGNTALDTAIRMRVAAEWVSATTPLPTSCADREYSEVEDYKIVARPNLLPPSTDFTASPLESCNGLVQFTDLTDNGPVSWFWDFGDGFTDTVQNPVHTYLVSDTFDVKLVTTNANGEDSLIKVDYIIRNGISPIPTTCTPITNAYCCGYGITNFSFGSINNNSSDAAAGYEDFSCLSYTELTEGFQVPISITGNTGQPEDFRVYLDLNNDGDFDEPNELIHEALNQSSPYSGNVIIPTAQVSYSQPLRLRVKSDAIGNFFDGCSNLTRGQAEDYSVLLLPNPLPPTAVFTDDQVNSCQDSINFSDLTINSPKSWFWDFGDGNTDTLQNPSHTYSNYGTYQVKLVVCNSNGCDSTTQTVNYNLGAPQAQCNPTTINVFQRITRFKINSINNTSPSSTSVDYEDFACDASTDLIQGQTYQVEIHPSSNFLSTSYKVWVDFDDDGIFSSSDSIMEVWGTGIQTVNVTIPITGSIVLDHPLRMRVVCETNAPIFDPVPCGNLWGGQAEDYTAFIRSPQTAPVASINVNDSVSCSGIFQFFDQSGFSPTSWTWDFGDGQSSTLQNPEHEYSTTGTYTVKLVACNAFGCDSTTNTVTVTGLFGAKLADCIPTSSTISANGISNVTIANLNNSTITNVDYSDYSCDLIAQIQSGVASILEVTTGTSIATKVGVWIDYNNNGSFTSNEKVMTSNGTGVQQTAIIVPANAVKNKVLRMRVMAEVDFLNPPDPLPCTDVQNGEIEDYGIIIVDNNAGPVAFFETNQEQSCNGTVVFKNNSFPNATAFEWFFGDGGSSTDENPAHTYTATGTYDVTLIAKNGFDEDTLVKTQYVNVSSVGSLPMANCYPQTQFVNDEFGILRFDLGGISNINSITQNYEDYTCGVDTILLNEGTQYPFLANTGTRFNGKISIWIDYNNDGDFDDVDEAVFTGGVNNGNHLGSISVPGSVPAESQLIRVRVIADHAGAPALTPCIEPEQGQVEDYIAFVNPSGFNDLINTQVSIHPNPVEENLFLDFPTEWEISANLYDLKGINLRSNLSIENNQIWLGDLPRGLYILELEAEGQTGHFKLLKK